MKNKAIIILLILFTHSSFASELPPRSFLGVSGGNSSSSIEGALVDRVLPDGTGDLLKLKTGDLITTLNRQPIKGFSHLVEVIQTIQVNDKIDVSILRDGKNLQLSASMKSRPKEVIGENSRFEIIYDSVKIKNSQLRSIVYRPHMADSKNKKPAVYFIQGYTCDSIDYGFVPNSSGHQLLTSLADAGYVVYKIEKFGIGDSIGDIQCSQIDFSTELAGFNAGLEALKKYDFVDKNNVHIFGHSLGGVYAPLIAEHSPVKSIISYGAVVQSWHDYLLDIYSVQSLIFGTPKQEAESNRNTVAPLLNAWLKTNRSWKEIIESGHYQSIIDTGLIPISSEQVFHRHYSFFRDLNNYDLAQAWANTKSNVLAIHGSLDIQAINDQWATQMTSLPKDESLKTKKVVLQGAEHGFLRYESMSKYLTARTNRTYNPGQPGKTYDPRVSETIIEWLNSLTKEPCIS
jgi:dienelactone hydrolase